MGDVLLTPNSLEELQLNLNASTDQTTFISGGTDMILSLNQNGLDGRVLVDLSGISEMKYIDVKDHRVRIGAGTTLAGIVDSDLISEYAPMLKKAADCVGSTQIRNAATVGGNVANAFAGADLIPPLVALEAELLILGKQGEKRTLGIQDFLLGNRKNALEIGEILLEISFNNGKGVQYFGKVGSRSRVTISKLNMAVKVDLAGYVVDRANVVFGALGQTAFNSTSIESYLEGMDIRFMDLDAMNVVFVNQVDEAIPGRTSRSYKRDAVLSLAAELFERLKMEVEVQYGKSI